MAAPASDANAPASPLMPTPPRRRGASAQQLRLVITIPTILILVALIYGVVSYTSFSMFWDQLDMVGAGDIARELLRIHMNALILLAFASVAAGLILSFTILRPIRALAQATREVGHGRLDRHAMRIPSVAELDDLSTSFNQMLDNLNHSLSERSRRLMEGMPIGVMTTDMEGRIGAVSPLAGRMLGAAPERMAGLRVSELLEIAPKPAHVLVEYLLDQLREPAAKASAETALSDPQSGETLTVNSTLLRDGEGEPYGYMFSFRESARMRDLSDQLSRSDQLAALGTFTLGLAHELRNPLGAIKGFSQLLLLERELPGHAADYLGRMVYEVDRVDSLVRQLFDLSEQPLACRMPTDLNETLERAAEAARQEVEPDRAKAVALHLELELLPPLMLEQDRLAQAFAKIIQNAYEFAPAGAAITLATRRESGPEGEAWRVEVRNGGSAIAPENLRRIFEPFFTTREKATGLGLTIARQIVAQNGGSLEAAMEHGEVIFRARFAGERAPEPAAECV